MVRDQHKDKIKLKHLTNILKISKSGTVYVWVECIDTSNRYR